MLKSLKDLFDSLTAATTAQAPARSEHLLQLAAAVLLVEVMRSDADIGDAEREAVTAALGQKFGLDDDESARLMELAHDTARGATDLYSFTSRINEAFTMERKIEMVEQLWRVAYADGVLNAHENHLMRKIGDLLYVPHGAYVAAKARAREAGPGAAGAQPIPAS
jgi:uncharacterized tellurite resistance protein B-like protein